MTITVAVVSLVIANVLAALNNTERTHQIMYTIAIATAWDFFVIQATWALIQASIIWNLKSDQRKGKEPVNGCIKLILNWDIARIA